MHIFPITSFVVKVHSLCNLNCDYCYEYNMGNSSWKSKPKRLQLITFRKLIERISEHLSFHKCTVAPFISFHGGEPLLLPASYFDEAITLARCIIPEIEFGMQTNGVLLTQEYLDCFIKHGLRLGISLDGPKTVNDAHRVDHKNKGSFDRVMKAIQLLKRGENAQAWGGVLCVMDIGVSPQSLIDFFMSLDPPNLDFLEPNGNWERLPPGKSSTTSTEYAEWLKAAFDWWFHDKSHFKIRRFEEIIELLLGGSGSMEYFGTNPVPLITVGTDGSYEAVDQVKAAFDGAETLGLNLFDHSLDDVIAHPMVQDRLSGTAALSHECLECSYRDACGGGYYPHRYKNSNGFQNPSIYCSDYKVLFEHIGAVLKKELSR